mmetsp:Transcript_12277/g.30044  ORF Transcript_12277/g.30044 Transcript_12277/m.30044 type:complete len:301 (-) Transcript_12277:95-997(-)
MPTSKPRPSLSPGRSRATSLGSMPCAAMLWRWSSDSRKESTRRAKASTALSVIFWSECERSCVRFGTRSKTRGKPSTGTCLQMLAAVCAAVRCVFVSKKSMKVSTAASPLERSSGSGCSTASLCIARRDCSATSMNSIVSSRWQKTGTAPEAATLAEALGRTSRRCVRARLERSMISGLCSIPRSSTRTGRKASTLKPMSISSWPMDSISHSSVSASICLTSLSCSLRHCRTSFMRARPCTLGSRSSRPVPRRLIRFWRALLLEASLERASSISPLALPLLLPPPPPPAPPPLAAMAEAT